MKIGLILVLLTFSISASTMDCDYDGDGKCLALTDGIMNIRYLAGYRGEQVCIQAQSERSKDLGVTCAEVIQRIRAGTSIKGCQLSPGIIRCHFAGSE